MTDPRFLSVLFFAGGLISLVGLPLLRQARGWLILGIGLSLTAWALSAWPVLPICPAIGLGARAISPYLFGMGVAFILASGILAILARQSNLREHMISSHLTQHVRRGSW